MALRLGVPVFVNPPAAVAPALKWSLRRGAGGEFTLGLDNTGNAHVQIIDFKLAAAIGEPIAAQRAVAYVLPGQRREWLVKPSRIPPAGATLRLVAQTDAGEMKADLVLE
jgi:fimbrial chaperone protein